MVVSMVGGQQGQRQRLGQESRSPVKEEAPIPEGSVGRHLGPPHLLLPSSLHQPISGAPQGHDLSPKKTVVGGGPLLLTPSPTDRWG